MAYQPPPSTSDEPGNDELRLLLEVSARVLGKKQELEVFLDWIADSGPVLAPRFAADIDPRTGPIGDAFRAIGVNIYLMPRHFQ